MSAVYDGPPRSSSIALGLEPLDPADRRLHHGEPVHRRRDGPGAGLLPRLVGHHQQHPVEPEGVPCLVGRHEMADVGRIERPAEHAQSLAGTLHRRSVGAGPNAPSRRETSLRREIAVRNDL